MSVTRSVLFLIPFALGFGDQPTNMMAAIPLHFEPNLGQMDSRVCFTARSGGMSVFLTPEETVFARSGDKPVRMKLRRSRPARYEAMDRLPGVSNYYRGNDPKKWREGVPHYKGVRAKGVYEGVDVVYYGNARRLEYDFVVAQGADPSKIELAYEGTESMRVDRDGDLVLVTKSGELRQRKPVVYQEVGGRRVEVAGSYRIRGGSVGFELARYDASKPVVIDPILEYGTFFGNGSVELVKTLAVDPTGAVYAGGSAQNADLPRVNANDFGVLTDSKSGFITKLNPAGTSLVYSTYVGGAGQDWLEDLAVDGAAQAIAVGSTNSPEFPLKAAIQTSRSANGDAFVIRLAPNGTLVSSTLLGQGKELLRRIAVDGNGIHIAGRIDAPTASGATSNMGIYVRLSPDASIRQFSRTLEGTESFDDIALDPAGSVYLVGSTKDGVSVGTPGSLRATTFGRSDAFVAKLSATASQWVYITHIGSGFLDRATAVTVDRLGQAHLAGWTADVVPLTGGFGVHSGGGSVFISVLNATGSALVLSRLVGGSNAENAGGIAVTPSGDVIVSGWTASVDFPQVNSWVYDLGVSGSRVFICKFAPSGTALFSSLTAMSYSSAAALTSTPSGAAIIAGTAHGHNSIASELVTPGAFDTDLSQFEAVISRFADGPAPVQITVTSSPVGRQVVVDGKQVTTPAVFAWQPGTQHTLDAQNLQWAAGIQYAFTSWSHGGSEAQRLTTPASATVLTATYAQRTCNFSISPPGYTVRSPPTSVAFQVTVEEGCVWKPATSASWLNIEHETQFRTGPGRVVAYTDANTGGVTAASLHAGPALAYVTQTGQFCCIAGPTQFRAVRFLTPRIVAVEWAPAAPGDSYELMAVNRSNGLKSPITSAPQLVYFGKFPGANATRATISLPEGNNALYVRACNQTHPIVVMDSSCGDYATHYNLEVPSATPSQSPNITSPSQNQQLTTSTSLLSWEAVSGATSYEVTLTNALTNKTELKINTRDLSTIFTMKSSTEYRLQVAACDGGCFADPAKLRRFSVRLPASPTAAPAGLGAQIANGTTVNASWNPVAGADLYRIQAVQPNTGPGGGALTVAARQVSATSTSLTVPAGPATLVVNACNGDGCGPAATFPINPTGHNAPLPVVATPMPVVVADGPVVTISWSRIAGDNGSNTDYRIYVGDLSRDGPALDAITKNNFYGAYLLAEGRRYDALVFATQNGVTVQGPASGFMVGGTSATAPLVTSPTHNQSFKQGPFRLAWSPMPSTGVVPRYQYYVTRKGDPNPVITGITTGLFIDTYLWVTTPMEFQAIVRVCHSEECTYNSDAGWGPWSNTVTGTTTFTITP